MFLYSNVMFFLEFIMLCMWCLFTYAKWVYVCDFKICIHMCSLYVSVRRVESSLFCQKAVRTHENTQKHKGSTINITVNIKLYPKDAKAGNSSAILNLCSGIKKKTTSVAPIFKELLCLSRGKKRNSKSLCAMFTLVYCMCTLLG